MNIFDVLNQGRSSLHEPSISAMLGYLLDTHRDYGLGDTFFREFLSLVNASDDQQPFSGFLDQAFIDTDVALEEPYELGGNRKDIDIQVSILGKDHDELYRLIIENKVKPQSGSENQLSQYYQAILKDEGDIENLGILFITPDSRNSTLKKEFENLKVKEGHSKHWIYWNGDEEQNLITILKAILAKEASGDINPINEYIRHTIKAFLLFLSSLLTKSEPKKYRFGEDLGEIVDEMTVTLHDDEEYRIVRRTSQQIPVFHEDEKQVAKPILRKIIREKQLDIPLQDINTRQMGRKIMAALQSN